MLNLSIGVLTYNAPHTLSNTLLSYLNYGLKDLSDDIIVWIQKSHNNLIEEQICKKYGVKYILSEYNKHIAGGFKGLVESFKNDYIILLENDFVLIEPKIISEKLLKSGINFLENNNINMVRLRSRHNPGFPNWGVNVKGKELVNEFGCITHLSESIYWTSTPEKDYPNYIEKISDDPVWYKSSSKYCNFTNNPCMYSKEFYKKHIYQFCIDNTDLETEATKWWCNQNFNCIFGGGLFKHERYDGK